MWLVAWVLMCGDTVMSNVKLWVWVVALVLHCGEVF